MKARDVAVVACRALAIYAIIRAVNTLAETALLPLFAARNADLGYPIVWTCAWLMPPALLGVAGIFFWRSSGRVADWMLRGAGETTEPTAGQPASEQRLNPDVRPVVFAGIGVFLLATRVPDLLSDIVCVAISATGERWRWSSLANQYTITDYATRFIVIGIGAGLVFGARTVATGLPRVIRWLRGVGREHRNEEQREARQ